MKNRFILPVFWALLAVFILSVVVMWVFLGPPLREQINNVLGVNFAPSLFLTTGAVFFLLGLVLLILIVRAKPDRLLKRFLMLTGSSAVGIFLSILLHNLFSGLLGLEEPVFFMMAIFIFPLAYLVGIIGSIILIVRRKKQETQTK